MKEWKASPRQERLVELLLAGKMVTEACETIGITRQSFYGWRKNPNFLNYFEQRRREVASSRTPRVDIQLFAKVLEGDVAAMRLFYEVFGSLRTGGQVVINNQAPVEEQEPGKKVLSMLDELEQKRKAKLNVK